MKRTCILILSCVSMTMMLYGCAKSPSTAKPFCIVALPDIQNYSSTDPHVIESQMKWIRENRQKLNIICSVFEGDLTNENLPAQWDNVQRNVMLLDGQVPCCMVAGNHDGMRDTAMMNKYFPVSKYEKFPWFGGSYQGHIENCYYNFKSGQTDLLVLCIEFGPRNEVLKWANEVIAKHPKSMVVIVTHSYVYSDNTLVGKGDTWNPHDYYPNGDTNDGDDMWEKLVRRHKNICMVLSGHILNSGVGRLTSVGDNGNSVHQMLANYQCIDNKQNGFLRIIKFIPTENRIEVRTYSTLLNVYKEDPDNKFDLSWNTAK